MLIDPGQLVSSGFIDPMLARILQYIEDKTGITFNVTSQYRPGDTGVHGTIPLRAWDLRCFDKKIGDRVCEIVNKDFKYDHNRENMKCALCHDTGSGLHLHIQAHPNTIRITHHE